MEVSAGELADLLGGEVDGDPDVKVSRPAKIEEGSQGSLTFLASEKYEPFIYSTGASIVLVSKEFTPKRSVKSTMVRVADVRGAMAKLMQHFQPEIAVSSSSEDKVSIHPSASVGEDVQLGAFVVVGPGSTIGDRCTIFPNVYLGAQVTIGVNCTIHPGVRIYHDCVLGDRVTIHANSVIGSDGFGYAPSEDGTYEKIPHVGNVVVGNDVEIGANCTIDRGSMGSTRIMDGAKIDNLVHLAHNVSVGPHTAMAAQVGVAGSTKIGANCQIGGQAGLVGHISIADGTRIQAQSGVMRDTQAGDKIQGTPAFGYVDFFKSYAIFRRLTQWARRWKELEDRIRSLESRISSSSDERDS